MLDSSLVHINVTPIDIANILVNIVAIFIYFLSKYRPQ